MATSFTQLQLLPTLLATLAEHRWHTLTDIQALALPALLDRRSVVAIAETGSGKTLSYALPVLDRLKRLEDDGNRIFTESEPRAVVIVPTRELGEQVCAVFKVFTHQTRLRVRSVLGGQKLKQNRESVAGMFEILVATPGRLERLVERKQISVDAVRVVVLDEADQLLDLGFMPQVSAFVKACPSNRQLALFSATMSAKVEDMVRRLVPDAEVLSTAGRNKVVPTLVTRHVDVPDGRRAPVLLQVLAEPNQGSTMLFANTREQCEAVAVVLSDAGHTCVVHRGEADPGSAVRTYAHSATERCAFLSRPIWARADWTSNTSRG